MTALNAVRRYPLIVVTCLIVLLGAGLAFERLLGGTPSDASAEQWRPAGLGGQTVHALAFDHGPSPVAFAATEGGIFRRGADGRWRRVWAEPGIWSVVLLPDHRTVLAGSNQGEVLVSHDGGRRWQAHLVAPEGIYAVTAEPGKPAHILAAGAGGLFRSVDAGLHWQRRLSLPNSAGAAFVWRSGSHNVVFAGAVAGAPGGSTEVYVSRDGGESWRVFGGAFDSNGGIMSLSDTPPDTLHAGTMGHAVWSATLSGGRWRRTAAGMPAIGDHVAALLGVRGRPGRLYSGTLGFGIYTSRDAGRHWTNVSDGLPDGARSIVLSLSYSPADHSVYAGTTDGVYDLTG
ncbi:MAG: hypothetical protein JOZ41_20825 [Chloroflexi bacterium]|nr:hypothetical protein [Chloroflexota bacterium]